MKYSDLGGWDGLNKYNHALFIFIFEFWSTSSVEHTYHIHSKCQNSLSFCPNFMKFGFSESAWKLGSNEYNHALFYDFLKFCSTSPVERTYRSGVWWRLLARRNRRHFRFIRRVVLRFFRFVAHWHNENGRNERETDDNDDVDHCFLSCITCSLIGKSGSFRRFSGRFELKIWKFGWKLAKLWKFWKFSQFSKKSHS